MPEVSQESFCLIFLSFWFLIFLSQIFREKFVLIFDISISDSYQGVETYKVVGRTLPKGPRHHAFVHGYL